MVRAERGLLANALEEVLRMEPSTHFAFRRACSDQARVGDTRIPEGDQIIMIYGAANRDPARWPDADRFDPHRDTTGHVSFGHSFHTCMGKELARLEAVEYFNCFFYLAPAYALVEADYGLSFPLRGPQQLLIRKA